MEAQSAQNADVRGVSMTPRAPFKRADVRDLERVLAAIDRIEARHGDEYEDYEFDAVNQIRAAAGEALRHIEGES